ncbi:glycoside hydrolase family 9 protein, partial [Caldicellulosiruptoraceae bacterium PP1]
VYSVPGATTLGYLLLAYELFPNAFQEKLNIPESNNKVPDILDESRYEIEWLLKMQDSKSGGVYHKMGSAYFPDFRMPEYDTGDLYVAPISATAIGSFCCRIF